MSARALAEIESLLGRSDDADEVLRAAVQVLADEPSISWACVTFVEGGVLTPGPTAGVEDELRRLRTSITFHGTPVGELWVDGEADRAFLTQVSALIAAHVLIGWDTGGESWDP